MVKIPDFQETFHLIFWGLQWHCFNPEGQRCEFVCIIMSKDITLRNLIPAGLVLHNLFLHNFALMLTKNLHPFSNLRDKFRFNVIWNRWSLVALVLHWRLAESDITVTPSATSVDWLHWWYNHMADVVPHSTALAFVTKMSEKHKSTSPNVIQVENWRKQSGLKRN